MFYPRFTFQYEKDDEHSDGIRIWTLYIVFWKFKNTGGWQESYPWLYYFIEIGYPFRLKTFWKIQRWVSDHNFH